MRCARLDDDGYRCSATKNVKLFTFHGNPEHSINDVAGWVVVPLCPNHRPTSESNNADYKGSKDRMRRGKNGLYSARSKQ